MACSADSTPSAVTLIPRIVAKASISYPFSSHVDIADEPVDGDRDHHLIQLSQVVENGNRGAFTHHVGSRWRSNDYEQAAPDVYVKLTLRVRNPTYSGGRTARRVKTPRWPRK